MHEHREYFARVISFVEWFADECKEVYTGRGDCRLPDKPILVKMRPVEVMEAVTPRSCPYSIDHTRKLGPALVAGCAMVVKPSELTPTRPWSLSRSSGTAGSQAV
jgi:acyl-CoA reductase-like NAD-dependent aldehyde dehydrogenase